VLWPFGLQLDYESIDYIASLREGILEAHTGVITGFKKSDRGMYQSFTIAALFIFPLG